MDLVDPVDPAEEPGGRGAVLLEALVAEEAAKEVNKEMAEDMVRSVSVVHP